ncbi:MAG: Jag N-terminal domain-containing protein, partial [Pyramidobacter sp.]|nr:Jag N-terminal domain-containing protein [Pyramidobacter sp.]
MNNDEKLHEDEVLILEAASEEEARSQAASHWGIPEDEVLLNVLDEEKGFFGLFGRKMRIEARPVRPLHLRNFMSLLEKVIDAAWLRLEMNVQSDGVVNLSGPDTKILLGKHGDGLKALDYIVNLMARNEGPVPRVRLDCDGFRRHREKDLERIALSAAKDAMKTRRTVYLEPMSSWERRIVH